MRHGLPRDADDTITISAASISATADDSNHNGPTISASGSNFNRIQEAAARLVAIQELAKRKGSFSEEDNKIYANSLLELGQAATALALLQQTGQIKDFSVLLQPELFGGAVGPQKQPSNLGLEANNPADQKIDEQKLEEVTEQQLTPEEFLPPNMEDPYEDVNDSVAIMAPKKDAAVAEAKPVGEWSRLVNPCKKRLLILYPHRSLHCRRRWRCLIQAQRSGALRPQWPGCCLSQSHRHCGRVTRGGCRLQHYAALTQSARYQDAQLGCGATGQR